jgi:L-fuconate dehydratase
LKDPGTVAGPYDHVTTENRVIEFVDHLHEHFTAPVIMRDGHYSAPLAPGFSATMREESIAAYHYPDGTFWIADRTAQGGTA